MLIFRGVSYGYGWLIRRFEASGDGEITPLGGQVRDVLGGCEDHRATSSRYLYYYLEMEILQIHCDMHFVSHVLSYVYHISSCFTVCRHILCCHHFSSFYPPTSSKYRAGQMLKVTLLPESIVG